jgi:hypothetical protein
MKCKDEGISTDEIEVTPKMIAAANGVLESNYLGDGRYDLGREVIVRIYVAMKAAADAQFQI